MATLCQQYHLVERQKSAISRQPWRTASHQELSQARLRLRIGSNYGNILQPTYLSDRGSAALYCMTAFNLDILPANLKSAVTYQDLAAGEILFYQDDPATAIFAVESGRVSLIHYTEAGKTVNHYSAIAGEYFAEVALFNEVYVCTVMAEMPSRIVSFPKQLFITALGQDPDLSRAFIEQLARRLHYTKLLLELRGIRSARERVLHYLRVITPLNEKTVSLNRHLKQIAGDIGISPEVFSRTLTQLQNERLITRTKRKITLND